MLWIEHNFENTSIPPFLTNTKVDMVDYVDLHKVVVKRIAFLAFLSARNEGESVGEVESEGLKHQFSQMERDLDLEPPISCDYAHPLCVIRIYIYIYILNP
jgi:hypothetical protein